MEFIDLQGASGRTYRFKRWPAAGPHPPIAGNYAIVRRSDRRVTMLGISDNLAEARDQLASLGHDLEAFTRLNVSRADREAEHADVCAAYPASASTSA
jgi:hypothetical protein